VGSDMTDDASYGISKLREEEQERARLRAERQRRIIYELTSIKGTLWALVAILLFIAWRLS
jgi:CHASE3 domain sensor protein